MQVDVGTSEVELDTSDYPDQGSKGQALVLENLGTGNLFVDTLPGVTADTGIKIAEGGSYEVPNWSPGSKLYMIASVADTDVRYMVVG